MGAQFECPYCAQVYSLSDEQAPQYAGQRISCSRCGKAFVVPESVRFATTPVPASNVVVAPRPQLIGQPPSYAPATPVADPRFIPPPAPPDWMQPPTGAMAIGSLISAIIGFCIPILPSLLAMVFGAIALNRARNRRLGGRGMAIAGIVVGAVGLIVNIFLLVMIVLPQWHAAQSVSARGECEKNLAAAGAALLAYASENGGSFPASIEELSGRPGFDRQVLSCPAAPAAPAARGGKRSYVYAGAGLTRSSPPECVLMYESLEHHDLRGMNVLFVDGRVSFIGEIEASKAIPRLKKGKNPPWTVTGN